jgi:hypothetical protein
MRWCCVRPSLLSSVYMCGCVVAERSPLLSHVPPDIGDVAYARGYASEWPNFFDQIEPLASAVPWMTTDGNHERDFPDSGSLFAGTDSGGECGVPYAHRFAMPTPSAQLKKQSKKQVGRRGKKSNARALLQRMKQARHPASASTAGFPSAVGGVVHDTPWYSQNFGSVHFVLMSTEHDFSPASEQYAFLEAGTTATVHHSVLIHPSPSSDPFWASSCTQTCLL